MLSPFEVLSSAPPKVWCKCAGCGERAALYYYEPKPTTWNEGPPDELRAGMVVQTTYDKKTKIWLVGEVNCATGICGCCDCFRTSEIHRWQWCWLLPPRELAEVCEAAE